MTLKGFTFDRAKVTAADDGSLFNSLAYGRSYVLSGIGEEMEVTTNLLTATVKTGRALIQGRLVEVKEPETIDIPSNATGYLVISIDLSKQNESSGTPGMPDYTYSNNQIIIKYTPNPVQGNLNDNGIVYDFILGTIKSNGNQVTFTPYSQNYGDLLSTNQLGITTINARQLDFNPRYASGVATMWYGAKISYVRMGNIVQLYWVMRQNQSVAADLPSAEILPKILWPAVETVVTGQDGRAIRGMTNIRTDGKFYSNKGVEENSEQSVTYLAAFDWNGNPYASK